MSFSLSRHHRTNHAKFNRVKGSGHGSNAFPVTHAVEKMFVTNIVFQPAGGVTEGSSVSSKLELIVV